MSTVVTLAHLIKEPMTRFGFDGCKVRIWSGEHRAYWGPKGSGYYGSKFDAGIYDFDDAWNLSNHAGPEKKIEFRTVPHLVNISQPHGNKLWASQPVLLGTINQTKK